jgi:threonine synthase
MPEYISTRDTSNNAVVYGDTVLEGLAPDGGLYVPREVPRFSSTELQTLLTMEYAELAAQIKHRFTGETVPLDDLRGMTARAYDASKFPDQSRGIVTPVRRIEDTNIYIQNLSLGPTAAFKDMAMQLLAAEMEYFLSQRGQFLDIVGATSGDTGPAAEAALRGLSRVRIAMLSPLEGMSDFQRAQMGELSGDGVTNISVRGRFDDCQDMVKAVMQQEEFRHLGAVNSINWARISAQVAYYFAGYAQVAKNFGDEVDFTVPTGNFGDALAGFYARAMGLPIRKIILATNENDVLHRFFQEGVYQEKVAVITSSPSMDISKASNLERLIYAMCSGDTGVVRSFMERFGRGEAARLSDFGVVNTRPKDFGFDSDVSTAADRLATMRWTAEHGGGVIDPHTADAVTVARRLTDDSIPNICLETALAVKFEPTVHAAGLEIPNEQRERFSRLFMTGDMSDCFDTIDPSREELAAILREVFTKR